ncbi:unnamed protein product [Closterium sp. NIES-54]
MSESQPLDHWDKRALDLWHQLAPPVCLGQPVLAPVKRVADAARAHAVLLEPELVLLVRDGLEAFDDRHVQGCTCAVQPPGITAGTMLSLANFFFTSSVRVDASRPTAARASRPAARTSRPAAACASRPVALRVTPCCNLRIAPHFCPRIAPCSPHVAPSCSLPVAPCCPQRRALLQPARHAPLLPARPALLPCPARALMPWVDSSNHCLTWTLCHRSSFASGSFSEAILVVEVTLLQRLVVLDSSSSPRTQALSLHSRFKTFSPQRLRDCVSERGVPGCAQAAALGASDSAAALGASESAAALGASASTATGLHLPSFTTNLVSNAVLQDQFVTVTTPGGEFVVICTDSRTGAHLATFTRRPGSLPPLLRSLALPCIPCVEGRQRAAPHSSKFPPTTAPLQTLRGTDQERYFLLVVDDYTSYTTVFPLRSKVDVSAATVAAAAVAAAPVAAAAAVAAIAVAATAEAASADVAMAAAPVAAAAAAEPVAPPRSPVGPGKYTPWNLPTPPPYFRLPPRPRSCHHVPSFPPTTAPFQTLHLDVWGPSSVRGPSQERYFLIVVDDYFRYTTVLPLQQKADMPTVLEPWLLARGDAQALCGLRLHSDRGVADYHVWGSLAHVRAPGADKLSSRTRACIFLGFPLDTSGWQFYDPVTCQFLSSQDVTFDESSSPPHRPVPIVSGGAGETVAKGEGTGAVGAHRAGFGGAGGVREEATPEEDTAVSTQRPRPASLPGFPSVPQFPLRSPPRPVTAEPEGVPAGDTGVPGGVVSGGSGSGGAGAVIVTIGLNVPKTKDGVHRRISAERLQTLIAFCSQLQMTCYKMDLELLDVAYNKQFRLHDLIKD